MPIFPYAYGDPHFDISLIAFLHQVLDQLNLSKLFVKLPLEPISFHYGIISITSSTYILG